MKNKTAVLIARARAMNPRLPAQTGWNYSIWWRDEVPQMTVEVTFIGPRQTFITSDAAAGRIAKAGSILCPTREAAVTRHRDGLFRSLDYQLRKLEETRRQLAALAAHEAALLQQTEEDTPAEDGPVG